MRADVPARRSLLRQTLHTVGATVAGQGAMIVAGVVIARLYGPSGKGLLNYVGIAIMFAVMLGDGLSASVVHQIGRRGADARASYGAALRTALPAGIAGAVAMLAVAALFPSQRGLFFVAIAFPFALYGAAVTGYYLIRGHVERTNRAAVLVQGGGALGGVAVAVFFGAPIEGVLWAWALGYVAGAVLLAVGLRREIGGAPAAPVGELLAGQTIFAARAALASTVTFLAIRIDVFIVSALLSASALGVYTLAMATGELMWQVARSLSWSTFGRIANGPRQTAIALTTRITRLLVAIQGLTALGFFIAGPALIELVYGGAFSQAGGVLRLLLPGIAIYSADGVLSYFIAVREGRPGYVLRIELIGLTISAAGTLLAIGRFGVYGTAVATTIAYVISFALKAVFVSKTTGCGLRDLLVVRPQDISELLGRLRAART